MDLDLKHDKLSHKFLLYIYILYIYIFFCFHYGELLFQECVYHPFFNYILSRKNLI